MKRLLTAAALLCGLAAAAPASAQGPVGDGAWSWFGDPRAVTHEGRTYVGWVDREGDVKVSSYDHASGERVTAVLQARLNQDDHANPSLHVRPDGRLMVFYSRHVGPAMHYRVSTLPGDVRSWEPPRTIPTNTPGIRGYTYPNPIRLAAEGRTYLFWRGGNYNPTFSTQADGSSDWSPARNLILMPNERPYTKYASSGGNRIHVAYTNAHPGEFGDVNIYYARVQGGRVERAGGARIGTLGTPISPAQGDLVYDAAGPTWVHDVAVNSAGRPVILLASFPSPGDHRYHYAVWNGSAWVVREMTAAGGSFRGDGGSPYYSGGMTLDHDTPSRLYLSRQTGPGSWHVEMWTTPDNGASWTVKSLTPGSTAKNVRPVSPWGMPAVGGLMGVIWMTGPYESYVDYDTSIAALGKPGANMAPVADAEPALRAGPAPLEVRFDSSTSYDPDGTIARRHWSFGDGSEQAGGVTATHTYASGGRWFPRLTVTDNRGAKQVFVDEVVVDEPAPPTVHSGGASGNTVHGAVDPENQAADWSVEYGPTTEYGAIVQGGSLPGDDALHQVATALPGLEAGRTYHYRLVATNASGTSEGEDRVMVAGRTPGSDAYRAAVLGTSGLAAYWRLGELSGSTARDEATGATGSFAGRFLLGGVGALGPLGNTAAGFDGQSGELAAPGPALQVNATLEGWFRWRSGTSTLRDHTGTAGWLLAFDSAGRLLYRLGGKGFDTGLPVGAVRDGDWHHVVATKQGASAALYVDGELVHSSPTGAGNAAAIGPWHIMRNGTNAVFSEGEADEVALYTRALSAAEVRSHRDLARSLADDPAPGTTRSGVPDPPAAGSGPSGGVLRGQTP